MSDGKKELSWASAQCPAPQVTSVRGWRGQIYCQHGCHLPGPDVSHGTCCNAELELRDAKIKQFILTFNALGQIYCLNPSTASSCAKQGGSWPSRESSGPGTPGFHQVDWCAPGTAQTRGTSTSLPAPWVWKQPRQEFQPGHRGMEWNGWKKHGVGCAGASIPTGDPGRGEDMVVRARSSVDPASLSCFLLTFKPPTETIKSLSGIILKGLFIPI